MDLSPQRIRTAEFSTVKKGLDPDEVRSFLHEVASEFERVQNQSTAMEARARAAVARLQEISESTPAAEAQPAATTPDPSAGTDATSEGGRDEVVASVDQAQTISRTLLLAQRTADTTIAEAEAEAARMRSEAEAEATRTIDSTHEMTARLLEEAREEARRTGEAERVQVESEVNSLLARRDFLESDVDHLQTFLVDQRSRLRDAAGEILELADRVPNGLGEVRRPLLSASDDDLETSRTSTGRSAPGSSSGGEAASASATSTAELPTVTAGSGRPSGNDESDDDDDDASGDDEMDDTEAVERDPLVIQTDIADEGPTGFSYDSGR